MGTKRKQHNFEFKEPVEMTPLSGGRTLAELASDYGVCLKMISTWKQELVKKAKELFERGNKNAADPQAEIDNRHRKIGQLQVERDFLAGQLAIACLLTGAKKGNCDYQKLERHASIIVSAERFALTQRRGIIVSGEKRYV